jgi:cell division protein FtsN
MNSGKNFTYLLYALLGGLVLAAGYAVLESRKKIQREADELARDQAILDSIDRMGAIDTAKVPTSTYVDTKSTPTTGTGSTTTTKPDQNGIVDEPAAAPKPTKPTTTTTTTAPKPIAKPTVAAPATPTKQLVTKSPNTVKPTVAPVSSGKYLVKVGVFSQKANADTEMERFIKMGYQDAEIVKYKGDKWCVAAKRSKTKADAERIKGDLERRGIDAQIITQ